MCYVYIEGKKAYLVRIDEQLLLIVLNTDAFSFFLYIVFCFVVVFVCGGKILSVITNMFLYLLCIFLILINVYMHKVHKQLDKQ